MGDPRDVLNGILWVWRTGAARCDLPERYPPYQTCQRRFQQWVDDGVRSRILEALTEDREERGGLDLSEYFIDATFVVATKGGQEVGKTKRDKGATLVAVAVDPGLPLSAYTASASPEVTLVGEPLAVGFAPDESERLVGNRACDSDPLDVVLAERDIEIIAPHRRNRKWKPQDGRALRRYKRRWEVERLFAWLSNLRRLAIRFERRGQTYRGFVPLGCVIVLLRHV